jgi:hypothetical protein
MTMTKVNRIHPQLTDRTPLCKFVEARKLEEAVPGSLRNELNNQPLFIRISLDFTKYKPNDKMHRSHIIAFTEVDIVSCVHF